MQLVKIKGKNDRIEILLNDQQDYFEVRDALFDKLDDMSKFFAHYKNRVYLAGRQLSEGQKREIASVMRRNHGLCDVEFTTLDALKVLGRQPTQEEIIQETNSVFIVGDVQGGQRLHVEGDLTVVGNVNPGAELMCTGNICVMGSLWGSASAGVPQYRQAMIVANVLEAERLQIATVAGVAPKDNQSGGETELAYIDHGLIVVESLEEYHQRKRVDTPG